MKYTIEGFSQEFAMTLRKSVESRGKIITKKIDCTDLVILRWFVDFYPNMKKVTVDGKQYAWLTHKKLQEDLPLIDITKRSFIDRMQKLVEFDILTYRLVQEGGTFSLYGFGNNYKNLVQSNNAGAYVQSTQGITNEPQGVVQSNNTGLYVQPDNKDTSIINPSIKDTSIRDNNKIIDDFFESLWALYPKKTNKSQIKKATKERLYKIGYEKLSLCIERYKQELEFNGTDYQFIKAGSTFFNGGYEDYLVDDWKLPERNFTPATRQGRPNANGNPFLDMAREEGII